MICAYCRQVHVYRQPVEEVNHSGPARSAFEGKSLGVERSAFEGKSLGVELACMQRAVRLHGRLVSRGDGAGTIPVVLSAAKRRTWRKTPAKKPKTWDGESLGRVWGVDKAGFITPCPRKLLGCDEAGFINPWLEKA